MKKPPTTAIKEMRSITAYTAKEIFACGNYSKI